MENLLLSRPPSPRPLSSCFSTSSGRSGLSCSSPKPVAAITLEEIWHRSSAFARCQLPEVLEIVSQIPQTSVGRFDTKVIRASYADVYGGATVQESGPRSVATKRKTVGDSD